MKKQNIWRTTLVAALLGLIAEFWWLEEKLFFVFYEPHIYPMSRIGTRLEVLLLTPVSMFAHLWWITIPLICVGVFSFLKLRRLKREEKEIQPSTARYRRGPPKRECNRSPQ